LTIEARAKALSHRTMHIMRRRTRRSLNRSSLKERRHRTTNAMFRPARAPTSHSALRTALTSRSVARGACAARLPSSAPIAIRGPIASRETRRSVDHGAGAKIRKTHVMWTGERGGVFTTKTMMMRTTSSCSAEAAAGRRRYSVNHHRPDRFAFVHEVEGIVDLVERHSVRDQIIDIDFAFHIPVDDPGNVRTAARATECGPAPDASGHELEWTV